MNKGIVVVFTILIICVNCFSNLDGLKGDYTEFSGKVSFVTGGSSGMGFSLSLNLAQLGSKVVFICRDSHPNWYNGTWA